MSAAQEKATGNGKLDMAGIMAVLALAQEEERNRGAGALGKGEDQREEKHVPQGASLFSEILREHHGNVQDEKETKEIRNIILSFQKHK